MTEREAFEAYYLSQWYDREDGIEALRNDSEGFVERDWSVWQASRQQALEEERAAGCLVADALRELLSDTQHKEHADCEDGGWCPVRDGRRALEEFEARLDAIRSLTSPIGDKA